MCENARETLVNVYTKAKIQWLHIFQSITFNQISLDRKTWKHAVISGGHNHQLGGRPLSRFSHCYKTIILNFYSTYLIIVDVVVCLFTWFDYWWTFQLHTSAAFLAAILRHAVLDLWLLIKLNLEITTWFIDLLSKAKYLLINQEDRNKTFRRHPNPNDKNSLLFLFSTIYSLSIVTRYCHEGIQAYHEKPLIHGFNQS